MNIVALLGSPRPEGNSAAITRRFMETAGKLGAQTQTYILNDLNFRGCQACMKCKGEMEICAQEDDLTPVLEAVRESDALVMAFPVYSGEVTAPLKAFIDRTYSFLLPDFTTNPNPSRLPSGKKFVFIQVQGDPDETKYTDIFERYGASFKRKGFTEAHLIRVGGLRKSDDAANSAEIMALAEETAKKVMT